MARLSLMLVNLLLCVLCSAAQAGSTADALAAFEKVCLGNDTNFNNWSETFREFDVAEAGRLKNSLPTSYPAGDVIFYTGKYAEQARSTQKRDCNILLKGDQTNEAKKALRKSLRKFPWNKAKRSDVYYIPSENEVLAFDRSFLLPNNEEVILIVVRTTTDGNAGLLTAVNATVYPSKRN